MRTRKRALLCGMTLAGLAACNEEKRTPTSPTSNGSGTGTTMTPPAPTEPTTSRPTSTSLGTSTAPVATGPNTPPSATNTAPSTTAPANSTGTRGCSDGSVRCAAGLQCCGGIPYPAGGVCAPSCPLKSDRAIKEHLADVDEAAVLEKLVGLHVTEWSYAGESDVRHVGPMAQDFRAAFGLGSGDLSIHPVDANGVAVVAIQALHARLVALEAEVKGLRRANEHLRATQKSARTKRKLRSA